MTAATRAAHGASSCHITPNPKNAGTTAKPEPFVLGEEVLERGHVPLPGPPSRSAAQTNGSPSVGVPGFPGHEADVVAERLAVVLGDALGGVIGVAARVRPEHVVEEQQRERRAARLPRRSAAAPR